MPLTFFGIPFENIPKEGVLVQVQRALENRSGFRIATVNPEYLLEARKNEAFRKSLLRADLRIVDGFGIVLVAWLKGRKLTRYPGADFLSDLLSLAEKSSFPLVLLVKGEGLSSYDEVKAALLQRYPRLRIEKERGEEYSLVLCNYGAPEQELTLEKLPGTHLSMGVGGAFDYLTGKLPRAPYAFRVLGLEWLWRLILQPSRWQRIRRAVIIFPFRAFFEK